MRAIKANELFNTGATNAANTYNMNQLYDNFNINPTMYGDVEFTEDGRKLFKDNQENSLQDFYDKVLEYEKNTGQPMPDKTQETLYAAMGLGQPQQPEGTTVGQKELRESEVVGYPGTYNLNTDAGREGKEKKKLPKWAVPFYSGKMGA